MRFLPYAFLSMLLLTACGKGYVPPAPDLSRELEVSVDLNDTHRCSRISPEIEIDSPPKGTVSFDVTLEDTTKSGPMHGGGNYEYSGGRTAVIPEGALTRYYTGPCPPAADNGRIYQYVVKALDVKKRVIGIGTYAFEQE